MMEIKSSKEVSIQHEESVSMSQSGMDLRSYDAEEEKE